MRTIFMQRLQHALNYPKAVESVSHQEPGGIVTIGTENSDDENEAWRSFVFGSSDIKDPMSAAFKEAVEAAASGIAPSESSAQYGRHGQLALDSGTLQHQPNGMAIVPSIRVFYD